MQRLFLFILTVIFFKDVVDFSYLQDDHIVHVANKFVHQGFAGISEILFNPRIAGYVGDNDGTYRPIPLILNAIEFQFFGLNPFVGHLVNLILYGFAGICFYNLSLRFVKSELQALLISLFFIVLPVHIEIVANIKCRDEILGAIFFLVALNRYLKLEKLDLINFCFLAVGFLCKESVVVLYPIMFLFSKAKKEQFLSFLYYGLGISVLCLLHHQIIYSYGNVIVIPSFEDNIFYNSDFYQRIPTVLDNLLRTIRLLFIDMPVRFDYSYPVITLLSSYNPLTFFALLFVIILLVLKETRILAGAFLISWLFIANLFFLIGAAFAERLLFIPSIFSCLLVIKILSYTNFQKYIILFLLFSSMLITANHLNVYKNVATKADFAKKQEIIGVKDLSFVAQDLFTSGKYAEAAKYFKKRLFLNPEIDIIGLDLLNCYLVTGQLSEAKKTFTDLMNIKPTNRFLFSLGVILERTGEFEKGKEYINQAVKGDSRLASFYETSLYKNSH